MCRTSPVRRVALEAAWAWLDSQALAVSQEKAAVGPEVVGRVLACDVQSEADLPATSISVVDGFAVRADDILGASDYNLIHLSLGLSDGDEAGRAVAVVSGRPIPARFDTVLPVDCVERSEGAIEVASAVPRGNGVVRAGQAAASGSRLLSAGARITPADIMLLREAGCAAVTLKGQSKIAVISFGSKGGADTSGATLVQLIGRDGALASEIASSSTALCLERCSDADLVVVVGRSGWGDDDVAEGLICQHGSLDHHGLALRPCNSVGFGHLGGVPLLLLPGDPLSAWVAYELLVARLVRRWSSLPSRLAYGSEPRALSRKIASPVGTADWVPLLYEGDGRVTPVPIPAACPVSVLGRAQAFALIPAASEGVASGDSITIHPLKS
ncbi:hypothetical protein [Pleomorphomonas sp. PLEO]|uniref:hypothetical protein n=1 Tax=Pleomorphomonas sp. PLEO TaxID=3239306 RepID=UPI00351E2F28